MKKVKKKSRKSRKNTCPKGGVFPDLTKAQTEVFHLLTKEFLSPKKVAIRRRCSKQAVYEHIDILKKKGYLKHSYLALEKNVPTPTNKIRLHGQEFNIQILFKETKYKEILKKSNTLIIDGNTIRLFRNSIEVYSGNSFYSDDVQKATSKSFQYWNKFFVRLEDELKIILIRNRSQNIKLVNQHYAEINNELAKDLNINSEKIRVYTTEEGKLWFLIDNSFNLHEAETVGEYSKQNMGEVIKPFFEDLRRNKHFLTSEQNSIMVATQRQINDLAEGIKVTNEYVQIGIKQINNLASGLKAITDYLSMGLKDLKKDVEESEKQPKGKPYYVG